MSHKGLRLLIETTVRSIQDDIKFSYGKTTDFNQKEKKSFVFCNVIPLTASASFAVNNVSNYSKRWNVVMAFYKYDVESSPPEVYTEILDVTDSLVDRFINKLNRHPTIVITGISEEPFIKDMADIMTGQALSFQVTLNDEFDYCQDC